MGKSSKLAGIQLCRGLAAFAVILVHSGDETWGIPIAESAVEFRMMFYFAVPFFIAAYFYFATKRVSSDLGWDFWRKKSKRIVIPYMLWSSLFMLFKSLIVLGSENIEELEDLWSDPVAIIFLGKASYHLYFLPLLIAGTLLLYSTKYLVEQHNSYRIIIWGFVITIALNYWLSASGNTFALGDYTAFSRLLEIFLPTTIEYSVARLMLVNLSWIIYCIPYFLLAVLLNHLLEIHRSQWLYFPKTSWFLLFGFFLMNIVKSNVDLVEPLAVVKSFLLLLWGISISHKVSNNWLIGSLGACSFGIYLIHPFIKSLVDQLLPQIVPQIIQSISIVSMLVYCLPTFIISWLVVHLMRQHKLVAQYL